MIDFLWIHYLDYLSINYNKIIKLKYTNKLSIICNDWIQSNPVTFLKSCPVMRIELLISLVIAEVCSTDWAPCSMFLETLLCTPFVKNVFTEQFNQVCILSFFCLVFFLYKILKTDRTNCFLLKYFLSNLTDFDDFVLFKKPAEIVLIVCLPNSKISICWLYAKNPPNWVWIIAYLFVINLNRGKSTSSRITFPYSLEPINVVSLRHGNGDFVYWLSNRIRPAYYLHGGWSGKK